MELGTPNEAQRELERISPGMRSHPDVLDTRWSLCAMDRQWEAALALAECLVEKAPGRCSGWIHRSYSLHELKRTEEARDRLLPATSRFPTVSTIPYNLACYECQLGRLDRARRWLGKAMRLGKREDILAMALQDPDLGALRDELVRSHKRRRTGQNPRPEQGPTS
jgi:hypothetical protein